MAYEITAQIQNSKLRGCAFLRETDAAVTNHLASSSPVHNNTWNVRGVFETETDAAIALRDYLGYEGSVWGVDNIASTQDYTVVHFRNPKIGPKDYGYSMRTLAI
jgi:hypothetical protein